MKNRIATIYCLLLSFTALAQTPTANFKSDIPGGCSPIVVNFEDLSTGNPTTWYWDFGNGSTSTRQNPSTTYFNEGTYTVKLTVTNASGSHTVTKTAFITVYLEPVAAFIVDKNTGCSPAVIQFTDRSTTPAGTKVIGWKWDFGDGGTSTEQNPKYIYRNAGSYTVTLTINNDKGCTKILTKPNSINITPGVAPSFNYNDPGVCSAPATINYMNQSAGPGTLRYTWDLGNGTRATSLNAGTTYTSNGTYRVSLIVSSSDGCTDSTIQNVVVGRVNTNFTVPTSICPKAPVQFINTSTPRPISSEWRFSNGTTDNLINGKTVFDKPGTYTVTLINTYTVCTDTLRKTITVGTGPVVDFKASDSGKCAAPFIVSFTHNTPGNGYNWDFGDGSKSTDPNPTYTYTKLGDFDVTLIVTGTNGCVDTLKKSKYIKIRKPVITLPDLPVKGCIPYTVKPTAAIQSVDSILTYKWDFGDGGSSTAKQPTYIYTKEGTYDVTLTITTSTGCTETFTLTKAAMVGTKPRADFTAANTNVCASTGVQFINKSPDPTDKWQWDFGDGTTGSEKNPFHVYNDTGFLDVKLTVFNSGCAHDTTIKRFVNIKPPVSKFTYVPNCANKLQYTFKDASIKATSWTWNFGDGTTFNGQNPPTHFFPSYGTYNVSLTTTGSGCTYTLTKTIVIADYPPEFSATVREGCKPFTTSFTANLPNPGLMKKFMWDFGDGKIVDTGTDSTAQFTYTNGGPFYVKLITIDSFGCRHELRKDAYIKVYGPAPNFGSVTNSGCKGLVTTFIDSTKSDGVNNPVSWKWNFGDGTTQTFTAPPFQHTYDSIGNYDVTLTVTDARGCMDSITRREFVKISNVKADWSTSGATCPGAGIGFSNNSLSDLPFGSFWSFGDGNTSTQFHSSNVYKDTGYYTVKLKIRDILGCEDSLTKTNAVYVSRPVASFDANNFTSFCVPFEAKFVNTSTFYESSFWNLSAATSNQHNPSLYYTSRGVYPIKLVVTSPGGCKDSATNTVRVFNSNEGELNYTPLFGCTPLPVSFDAFAPMNARFIWDFGDGNVIDTTVNKLTHTYVDFGDFVPKIILKEPSGTCTIARVGNDVIDIKGVIAKYTLSNSLFCDSGIVSISDSTTHKEPIVDYNWDFGDGNFATVKNPVHQYGQPGQYNVTLIATTASGCADTLQKGPIMVVESPLISISSDSIICLNDRVLHAGIMERPDTSAVKWKWTFPNGNTSQSQDPVLQQYVKAGTFQMTAIATNSSGCADTATKSLLVNPLPVITLPASLTKVVGMPLILPGTYSSNVVGYNWTPAATLDCSTCPQPTTNTKFTTNYTVSVVDSNSCTASENIQVIVVCKGATIFLPNTFSPNGDGANDVFYARGTGLDRVKSLRVFNRWGQVVFEQNNFPVNNSAFGWNGTYKGVKAQADVYIYQVEIFCENSEVLRFEGNIALIQ